MLTGPITLADGNGVSGLRIESTVGNAITGTGINGTVISANQIVSPTLVGVALINATGDLFLTGNVVTGTGDIGFDLQFDSVNPNLLVENNDFADTGDRAINLILTGTADAQATLAANEVNDSGAGGCGIEIVALLNSQLELTATGNNVDDTMDGGFCVFADGNSQVTASIVNNTITSAAFEGLILNSAGAGQLSAEVRGNVTLGNFPNFGFLATALNTSQQCLSITGNTSDRFVFEQFDTTVLRVENFANLQANNTAGTPFVNAGAVTDVPVGTCGF